MIRRLGCPARKHRQRWPHLSSGAENHQGTLDRSYEVNQYRARPREDIIQLAFAIHFFANTRLASSSASFEPISYQIPGTRQVYTGVRG